MYLILTLDKSRCVAIGNKLEEIEESAARVRAIVKVTDDYTMSEVVRAVKNSRYEYFRLTDTMKRFVKVQ